MFILREMQSLFHPCARTLFMSGRRPAVSWRERWRLRTGRRGRPSSYVRPGETMPRHLEYRPDRGFARPTSRPRTRRRSGVTASAAGSRALAAVAPSQRFGVGARRAAGAEVKIVRNYTDPVGDSVHPVAEGVTVAGYTMSCSYIEQGAGSDQRVGSGVRAMSLTLRAQISGTPSSSARPVVRFLVLRSKTGSKGTAPPMVADVLQYPEPVLGIVTSPLSLEGMTQYTALADWRVSLGPANSSEGTCTFDRRVAIDSNIVFNDTNGADALSGYIWLLMFSDQPDAHAAMVLLSSELTFTDP